MFNCFRALKPQIGVFCLMFDPIPRPTCLQSASRDLCFCNTTPRIRTYVYFALPLQTPESGTFRESTANNKMFKSPVRFVTSRTLAMCNLLLDKIRRVTDNNSISRTLIICTDKEKRKAITLYLRSLITNFVRKIRLTSP